MSHWKDVLEQIGADWGTLSGRTRLFLRRLQPSDLDHHDPASFVLKTYIRAWEIPHDDADVLFALCAHLRQGSLLSSPPQTNAAPAKQPRPCTVKGCWRDADSDMCAYHVYINKKVRQ